MVAFNHSPALVELRNLGVEHNKEMPTATSQQVIGALFTNSPEYFESLVNGEGSQDL